MKSFAAAIAAFAAVSTVSAASTSGSYASCSTSVLTALLTDQYIDQCASDSGYVFTAASIPTQDVIDLMCASTACKSLLADAQAMDLSECILPVGDNILLLADLIDYVPAHCPASSSGSTTSSTPTATTAPTTTTSSSSATDTDTPTVTTAAATSSSSTSTSTTTTTTSTATAC
ncbi:hypothetical protein PHYBOEH_009014 [Phytophthora boehmeriae]|uniref:Elicitin n=1 Tax=Phytophthora boehmeriae TaxID=109152 RepID=A0A8T1VW01_9STRA|nr:hypothetical protein PHYBOEH_009014 [Phytophthora boehmeriae]